MARERFELWKTTPQHPSLKFEERRNGIAWSGSETAIARWDCARVMWSHGSGSGHTRTTITLRSSCAQRPLRNWWITMDNETFRSGGTALTVTDATPTSYTAP